VSDRVSRNRKKRVLRNSRVQTGYPKREDRVSDRVSLSDRVSDRVTLRVPVGELVLAPAARLRRAAGASK